MENKNITNLKYQAGKTENNKNIQDETDKMWEILLNLAKN